MTQKSFDIKEAERIYGDGIKNQKSTALIIAEALSTERKKIERLRDACLPLHRLLESLASRNPVDPDKDFVAMMEKARKAIKETE